MSYPLPTPPTVAPPTDTPSVVHSVHSHVVHFAVTGADIVYLVALAAVFLVIGLSALYLRRYQ